MYIYTFLENNNALFCIIYIVLNFALTANMINNYYFDKLFVFVNICFYLTLRYFILIKIF